MGSLKIGRIGVALDLDPAGIIEEADVNLGEVIVQIDGEIALSNESAAKSLKNELTRMALSEERFVPLTWSEDPLLDGYYQLQEASIEITTVTGFYPFSLGLRRIGSVDRVAIESHLLIVERTNNFAGVTPAPFHAQPENSTAWEQGVTSPNLVSRVFSDGTVKVYYGISTSINPVWSIAPADFYEQSCSFRYADAAAALQFATSPDVPSSAASWEISNGGVRVTPGASNARLDVEFYDGTAWRTHTIKLLSAAAELGAWDYVTVLKLNPQVVTIRLYQGTTNQGFFTLDLSLRRGSRFIEGLLQGWTSSTLKVQNGST